MIIIKIICSYSKTGEYHKKNNIENEDVLFCKTNELFDFYAVADGVSFCENSRKGAEIVCYAACNIMMNEFDYYIDSPVSKAAWLITECIKRKLMDCAIKSCQKVESFASTLCFFCIEKRTGRAISFTLGDSHLYIINSEGLRLSKGTVLYEDNVICATVTQNADRAVTINYYNKDEYDGFMLCTDGIWKSIMSASGFSEAQTVEEYRFLLENLKNKKIQDDATVLLVA